MRRSPGRGRRWSTSSGPRRRRKARRSPGRGRRWSTLSRPRRRTLRGGLRRQPAAGTRIRRARPAAREVPLSVLFAAGTTPASTASMCPTRSANYLPAPSGAKVGGRRHRDAALASAEAGSAARRLRLQRRQLRQLHSPQRGHLRPSVATMRRTTAALLSWLLKNGPVPFTAYRGIIREVSKSVDASPKALRFAFVCQTCHGLVGSGRRTAGRRGGAGQGRTGVVRIGSPRRQPTRVPPRHRRQLS